MSIPTWQECLDAGMSTTEAAKARGRTPAPASLWAKRNGVKFRDARKDAAHSERARNQMRKLNADPEFAAAHVERNAERMRKLHADPEFNPLAALTDDQRHDYDTLKKSGYTRAESFEALGIEASA